MVLCPWLHYLCYKMGTLAQNNTVRGPYQWIKYSSMNQGSLLSSSCSWSPPQNHWCDLRDRHNCNSDESEPPDCKYDLACLMTDCCWVTQQQTWSVGRTQIIMDSSVNMEFDVLWADGLSLLGPNSIHEAAL